MKNLIKTGLLVASIALLGQSALAQVGQRVVLEMYDTVYRPGERIFLKREINRQYPGINLQRYNLDRVRLVAKSRRGGGMAELVVGRSIVDRQYIAGNPRDFRDNLPRTYDRLVLLNNGRSDGVWQIHFQRQRVKVKRVVAFLQQKRLRPRPIPRPTPGVYVNVGSEIKAPKILKVEEVLYPNSNRPVSEIRVRGTKEKVQITRAYAVFGNGQRRALPELEGSIRDGNNKIAYINHRFVRQIVLEVTSPRLFGSRGRIQVQVRQH